MTFVTTSAEEVSNTTIVCFHNFADLPAAPDDEVNSTEFSCLGHVWGLILYPGGQSDDDEEGTIAIYLNNLTKKKNEVEYCISVPGCTKWKFSCSYIFGAIGLGPLDRDCCGTSFAQRSEIMDSLVDGALVINVHMTLVNPPTSFPPFIPENPLYKIIQDMFMDEESADIVFEVGGGHQSNNKKTKKAKTSLVRFPAHKFILRPSSTLAELCRSAGDKTSPIHIPDISPDIFQNLLFHLYGGKISDDDMKYHAREIIDAADRYGVIDLKLRAEACLVETTAFSIENLLDLLLYADSKNCALLKEAAIDFMLENRSDVIEKISFNDAPGAFVTDVLAAFDRKEKKKGLIAMRINDLRWRARQDGLEVDGSREMLITALKKGYEDSDTESEDSDTESEDSDTESEDSDTESDDSDTESEENS
jgi:hypothetical protein